MLDKFCPKELAEEQLDKVTGGSRYENYLPSDHGTVVTALDDSCIGKEFYFVYMQKVDEFFLATFEGISNEDGYLVTVTEIPRRSKSLRRVGESLNLVKRNHMVYNKYQ